VIWSDDVVVSASVHTGEQPVGSSTDRTKGSPPSGRDTDASQSHSSTARGVDTGATSSSTSKACSAPVGWLPGARKSGSMDQP
jgi:hypothetical protein